jgi:glycosyltransferase involved in cell wall biosynthesis
MASNNSDNNSLMKIAIFSSFYPFRGGIAQFSSRLFRALQSTAEVKAFTFRNQYPKLLFPGKTQMVEDGDAVEDVKADRILDGLNAFTYTNGVRKIKKFQPEVLIVNHWMSFFGWLNRSLAKAAGKHTKKVLLVHNLFPHEKRFFDKWMINKFIGQYDGYVVMSEKISEEIKQFIPEAKILQLEHPWYDHFGTLKDQEEARIELGLDKNKKTLLFFGLIRNYKGLDLLIDAFELLGEDYQLVIAGEVYGNENELINKITACKRKEDIHFFNRYIKDSEVSLYFSATDICVLPYRSATQSGVTAVSFFLNVPVVVTPVGAIPKIVQESGGGIVADNISPEGISQAIDQLFSKGTTHFKKNIEATKANYSWDHFAAQLTDFIELL